MTKTAFVAKTGRFTTPRRSGKLQTDSVQTRPVNASQALCAISALRRIPANGYCFRTYLAMLEVRGALVGERVHAFLLIGGGENRVEGAPLEQQALS